MVVALIPAVVSSFVVMLLVPDSLLEANKQLAVADSCSVAAPE